MSPPVIESGRWPPMCSACKVKSSTVSYQISILMFDLISSQTWPAQGPLLMATSAFPSIPSGRLPVSVQVIVVRSNTCEPGRSGWENLWQSPTDKKNGHILPTGQLYAPSAVINDAKVFQNMPEYARVCQSMPENARVC